MLEAKLCVLALFYNRPRMDGVVSVAVVAPVDASVIIASAKISAILRNILFCRIPKELEGIFTVYTDEPPSVSFEPVDLGPTSELKSMYLTVGSTQSRLDMSRMKEQARQKAREYYKNLSRRRRKSNSRKSRSSSSSKASS